MDRSKLSAWMGRLLLVVVSLTATLLLCEVAARWLLPPPQLVRADPVEHPVDSFGEEAGTGNVEFGLIGVYGPKGRRLVPNARAVNRPGVRNEEEVVIETNRYGLRYGELGPKGADELRVLVLGDSVTMGAEVRAHELFTTRAEALLANRPGSIRIINGGIPSADVATTFYQMLELLDPVDPDVVVIQLYFNDARKAGMFAVDVVPERLRRSRALMWAANRIDVWRQSAWIEVSGSNHDWDAWAEEFVEHQRRVYGGDWETFERMEPSSRDRAAADYGLGWSAVAWGEIEKVVGAAAGVCRQRGVGLGVMLAPVDLQVYGRTIDRVPQEHFAAMCGRLELACLDLLQPLRRHRMSTGDAVLYDQCHLNPVGHEIVAGELVAFLGREGLVPR
jgi:hypothetical protein